jgi:hypothetical protein
MATPKKISTVEGENNIKLIFTIKKDGIIESLLGATILLQFTGKNTGNIMYRQCTITDASAAECIYILTEEDLSVVDNYMTELEIEYPNGTKLISQNPIVLTVLPEIVENQE